MAEMSRGEAMKQIGEWYGGFADKPSEDAIHKAISDMQKLEKIEQILNECADWHDDTWGHGLCECFKLNYQKYEEKVKKEAYQQGREDAIEECITFIKEHSGEHYIDCDGYFGGQLELAFKVDDWIDELNELKEQRNE